MSNDIRTERRWGRTVNEAADILGLAPATLRAQIRLGKLTAEKFGRDYFITDDEVARYAVESKRRTA